MIPPLFRRRDPTIAVLYGAIVAQARDTRFYGDLSVPDTVLGRFDLIVLHTALVLRRLRAATDNATLGLAQGVFDAFCLDMDHNLREMGISDQGVPRQMQRVGEAFYGRAKAYDAALAASENQALVDALARNVYGGAEGAEIAATGLAAYVRRASADLDSQALSDVARGAIRFPEPAITASETA
jgi:cytochrome b pre-mRNA-processing protein 3